MPLWKVQTVGQERLDFLYENRDRGNRICLKPGVAYCLRAFYELLRDLIQGAWVRFVQKLNANRLGTVTDLGTFLFGQERASLEVYRPILRDVQQGKCLYCTKKLAKPAQVDHFIPWSRYAADLGHNFVLAHDQCNQAKSDHLAAERHLGAWVERNRLHQEELQCRFREAMLPCDLSGTIQIAKWVYQQTEKANGQVWVTKKVLHHLSPAWRQCFATG
jgi:5-methylcytosine-specific restriction endonuclease McrA